VSHNKEKKAEHQPKLNIDGKSETKRLELCDWHAVGRLNIQFFKDNPRAIG
jgi:hypothetical protein